MPVPLRVVRLIGLTGELSTSVSDIEARRLRFCPTPTGGKASESAIGSSDIRISELRLVCGWVFGAILLWWCGAVVEKAWRCNGFDRAIKYLFDRLSNG